MFECTPNVDALHVAGIAQSAERVPEWPGTIVDPGVKPTFEKDPGQQKIGAE
jgi:hypothetical protein